MDETFLRNIMFWGEEAQNKISSFHVAIFGLGGVGGYCAEALARSGIGELTLIDFDKVSKSNINRQIVALHSTIGMYKTDLFKERLKDINPDIKLNIINDFYTDKFDFSGIHYVADAIDSMRSKVNLLVKCYKDKIPVISSMGAGNRINPEKLYIAVLKFSNGIFISFLKSKISSTVAFSKVGKVDNILFAMPACLIISLSVLLKSIILLLITVPTISELILSNNGYDLPCLIVPNRFPKYPPVNSSTLKPV